MGYSYGCTRLHKLIKGILYKAFALCIKGRSRFIKDEDWWIFKDGTGYTNTLTLSTRKASTTVTNIRIVSFLTAKDKLMGIGNLRSFDYRLVCCIDTEGDVILETIVEEDCLLVYITNKLAEVVHS